jgi:hypothetical protein
LEKNAKSIQLNNNNNYINNSNCKKEQSEKNLKVIQEINTQKDRKDLLKNNNKSNSTNNNLLKLPIVNKDSINIMNITNFNNSNRIDKMNNSPSPNCFYKNDESLNNLIIVQDFKGKMTNNPLLPNKNKFEKIYQNFKDQEKSLREFKGNSEADAKTYFPNLENSKPNNLII